MNTMSTDSRRLAMATAEQLRGMGLEATIEMFYATKRDVAYQVTSPASADEMRIAREDAQQVFGF